MFRRGTAGEQPLAAPASPWKHSGYPESQQQVSPHMKTTKDGRAIKALAVFTAYSVK